MAEVGGGGVSPAQACRNRLMKTLQGYGLLGDDMSKYFGPVVLKGVHHGVPFLVDILPHGGRGGLPHVDGMIPISYPENSTITPCEIIEAQAPIVFLEKALRPDTGAPGRRRMLLARVRCVAGSEFGQEVASGRRGVDAPASFREDRTSAELTAGPPDS